MINVLAQALEQLQRNSIPELAAVILAIVYLILAVRQNLLCWYAALISAALFLYVFWQVDLYMESGLQVYYLAMAIYGWWSWRSGYTEEKLLLVTRWPLKSHLLALSFIALATWISGQLLSDSDQRLAYLDSFTTWSSIVTTYMVTRKILENWAYWLVIDTVSIYLYLDRELYFTVLLFTIYIVIILFGFRAWLKEYKKNNVPESWPDAVL